MSSFEEVLFDTLYGVMEQVWDQAEAELSVQTASVQEQGHAA